MLLLFSTIGRFVGDIGLDGLQGTLVTDYLFVIVALLQTAIKPRPITTMHPINIPGGGQGFKPLNDPRHRRPI
jgi:hypothetical protein